MNKASIHGFPLLYDNVSADGMRYLRDNLDYEEARVFFDQSRERGSCKFEDANDRKFILSYKNGAYEVIRKP